MAAASAQTTNTVFFDDKMFIRSQNSNDDGNSGNNGFEETKNDFVNWLCACYFLDPLSLAGELENRVRKQSTSAFIIVNLNVCTSSFLFNT